MSEAHRKKKQPEQVRRNLLDCTAKIAAEQGVAKVTIDAVAKAAGITKGGLLHHFSVPQQNLWVALGVGRSPSP